MGCFNTTGFLSRLPITCRDRVVCFIATVNTDKRYRELYIPDSIISPWCLPVRGEYDDYGSIENIDDNHEAQIIKSFFGVDDVKEIFDAVERCLYGKTLTDNIKYWERDEEEVKKYKKLLPMFKGCRKSDKTQLVLLFEHEKIYDYITEQDIKRGWMEIDVNEQFNKHLDLLKTERELNELLNSFVVNEDDPEEQAFSYNPTEELPRHNMFRRYGSNRSSIWIASDYLGDEHITDEQKGQLKAIINKLETYEDEDVSSLFSHTEGRSEMFMASFSDMSEAEYMEALDKSHDEIVKFIKLMAWLASVPMIINPSVTGDQDNNVARLKDLYEFTTNFALTEKREKFFYEEDDE